MGAPYEGKIWSEERTFVAVAVPYADGGMFSDGAAAGKQHSENGFSGARSRARGNSIASYEFDG